MPQSVMVSATRSMSWRTEVSRSGVPMPPRKYLETTTLVAIWVQDCGDFAVVLLEEDFALVVGDGRGAQFPLDGVEGIDALGGVAALDGHALALEAGRFGVRRSGQGLRLDPRRPGSLMSTVTRGPAGAAGRLGIGIDSV